MVSIYELVGTMLAKPVGRFKMGWQDAYRAVSRAGQPNRRAAPADD